MEQRQCNECKNYSTFIGCKLGLETFKKGKCSKFESIFENNKKTKIFF